MYQLAVTQKTVLICKQNLPDKYTSFGRPPLQTSARRPAFVSDDFHGSHWSLQTTVTIVSFLILPNTYFINRSRVSSGSIVSDYGLDDRAIGFRSPARAKDFSSVSRPVLGPTQPPLQWVPGVLSPGVLSPGVLSPGVKARPGRDADLSPPSSAEVENE
jgi:hypothetical protein